MYDDEYDDYRNASPQVRERSQGNFVPTSGSGSRVVRSPSGYPQPVYPSQAMAPYGGYGGYPPPMPYGQPPYGQSPYGYPPGYPQPSMNTRAIGRMIRAATPLVVSMLGLPTAPTAIPATGDTTADLKASLTNEANAITYQTALAQAVKRDETVFGIGEAIGILLEKGLT